MSNAAPDLSLPRELVDVAVAAALAEDLGLAGDITSEATIPAGAHASGVIATRKAGVVAGLQLAEAAFKSLDRETSVEVLVADGAPIKPGDAIVREPHPCGVSRNGGALSQSLHAARLA